jgi:uncharacterized protein YegL
MTRGKHNITLFYEFFVHPKYSAKNEEVIIMPFNPTDYTAHTAKPLPVVLMLDSSLSMQGLKIENLNIAIRVMMNKFADSATMETEIIVAIIAFGTPKGVELLTPHSKPYVKAYELKENLPTLSAHGNTPLGTALKMAKDMIDDKTVTPSPCYKPAVVVVTDGKPTDEWKSPLERFTSDGRSQKCQRLAVGIGEGKDIDLDMLNKFVSVPDNLLRVETADEILSALELITDTVSQRAKSVNPDVVPTVNNPGGSSVPDDDEPLV